MFSRKILSVIIGIILLVAAVGGYYGYTLYFAAKPEELVTLTFAHKNEIAMLDPNQIVDCVTASCLNHIHDNLVHMWFRPPDYKLQFEPQLATSWRVYNDSFIEFTLRKGVKFQDGTDFTAWDVVALIKRQFDTNFPALGMYWFSAVNKYEVVDNYTIRWGGESPFAAIANHVAMPGCGIPSSAALAEYYAPEEYPKHPVGTGPFMLVEQVKGEKVVMKKNPTYWGEPPKIDTLIWKPIKDDAARVAALEAGDVDAILDVPPHEVERLREEGFTVTVVPSARFHHIFLNMGKPPFNDKRVRWAMNYAIDREAICKSIFGGTAIPSLSTGAPSVFGYHKIEKPYHQYDPEKARELLAEAGYPNGFEVNCWMATGRFQMDRVEAESLVAYWADIGVKVNLEIMEYATLDAKQREQMNLYWKKGVVPDWDMSFWSWGDGTMDPGMRSCQTESGNWNNKALYNNTYLDELQRKAKVELDPEKRDALYEEIEEIIMEDAPLLYTVVEAVIIATKPNVKGIDIWPSGYYFFHNAYIEKK